MPKLSSYQNNIGIIQPIAEEASKFISFPRIKKFEFSTIQHISHYATKNPYPTNA